MPSYISSAQPTQVVALYSGNEIALVNQAGTVDPTTITASLQVAIGPDHSSQGVAFLVNTTNQTATVQVANQDTAANYKPYTYLGTAITAAAATTVGFPVVPGMWLRLSFGTAPSSGSAILNL